MFWTRLLSGIVLLAIALATFSFGNVFLAVPLWLISLIAYRELTKALKCATDEKKFNALEWIGFVGVTAYYATLFFTRDHTLLLMCIVALFMAEMFCYVAAFPKYQASQVMAAVFSFLYAPVLLSFAYLTRECENGIYLVWLILISSWGCDTCAYVVIFSMSLLGIHPTFPSSSSISLHSPSVLFTVTFVPSCNTKRSVPLASGELFTVTVGANTIACLRFIISAFWSLANILAKTTMIINRTPK